MTTAQLITRVKNLLAYDLDGYIGASPSDADVVSCLNDALLDIGKLAYIVDPKVVLTLTAGQMNYDIRSLSVVSRRCVEVFSVVIAGKRLWNAAGDGYGLWTRGEIQNYNPSWLTDASGSTSKALMYSAKELVLHPSPTSAIVAAGNHFLEAQVLPAPLDAAATSASPELEDELHEELAKYAAYKAAMPNSTEGHQNARLAAFKAEALSKAAEVGEQNRNILTDPGSTYAGAGFRRMLV